MAQSKEAYDLANHGWTMHIIGALVWLLLGITFIYMAVSSTDIMVNQPEKAAGISSDSIFSFYLGGGFCIAIAVLAMVFSVLIKWRVLEAFQKNEFEMAARYLTLFRGPGLLFGIGIGGAFFFLSLVRLKDVVREDTASKAATGTVAQATPICPTCGTPATWVHGEQKWHCSVCARFL